MWHMPYERMQVGDEAEDGPETSTERQARPENEDEPGHTPHTSEGGEDNERRMPLEEPGRTPGSAEGD